MYNEYWRMIVQILALVKPECVDKTVLNKRLEARSDYNIELLIDLLRGGYISIEEYVKYAEKLIADLQFEQERLLGDIEFIKEHPDNPLPWHCRNLEDMCCCCSTRQEIKTDFSELDREADEKIGGTNNA